MNLHNKIQVPKEYMVLLMENQRLQMERKIIANDIHDDIVGSLHGMIKCIEQAKEIGVENEISKLLSQIKSMCFDTLVAAKNISHQIRPNLLDIAGLPAAIEQMLYDFGKNHHLQIHFRNDCSSLDEMHLRECLIDSQSENIYRLIKEAMNNIVKHAKASTVSVLMRYKNNHFMILLQDNGLGMRMGQVSGERTHLKSGSGLIQMHARANASEAYLSVKSQVDKGTSVRLRIYLDPTSNLFSNESD